MPMTHSVEIRFNFFQVVYKEGATQRLPELLQSLRSIPIMQRQYNIYRTPRFLSEEHITKPWGSAFLFTTKRMKAIPPKIKEDNSRESLGLAENEGLAEDVVMACDRTGSVIALQQNKYSMSESVMASYLSAMLPNNPIYFAPVLKIDSLQRFCSAQQVRKLHIKLASPLDFTSLKELGLSTRQKIILQHMLSAPTLDISWSAFHEKEGLNESLRKIGQVLKEYVNCGGNNVLSLDAVLRNTINDAVETENIDLLIDRIFYKTDIPLNHNKEIDKQALLDAACEALRDKYDELTPFIERQTS